MIPDHRLQIEDPQAGWTFVETIIVVAIVLVLTSAVGIAGMRYVERARITSASSEIAALSLALDGYYLDNAVYPTAEQGLASLWSVPKLSPVPDNWSGPYVAQDDFADPWGNPYAYRNPGPGGLPYAILSYGADGSEGGTGSDADIVSWK